jgi:hypothetical protein
MQPPAKPSSRKKPGPKPRIRNPKPVEYYDSTWGRVVVDEWISGATVDTDERALRAFFKRRAPQLKRRPGESVSAAVGRIRRLAEDGLDHCDAGRWSDRRVGQFEGGQRLAVWPFLRYYSRRAVGLQPPKRPANHCLWIDTSSADHPLNSWELASKTWKVIFPRTVNSKKSPAEIFNSLQRETWTYDEWIHLRIRPAAERMFSGGMGRLAKAGKPAFLAAAVLADLLNQSPDRIADFLNHYRRTKPRTHRGKSS